MGNKERPIIIAVAPDFAITNVSKVKSKKEEPRQTPEWRSQNWESRENKAARIHQTEDQREGRPQRADSGDLQEVPLEFSADQHKHRRKLPSNKS